MRRTRLRASAAGVEHEADPADALERLAQSTAPLLVGVRHHSPACAAMMPAMLDAFGPSRILLELPVEFQRWIEWLAHPSLEAPVALAGVSEDGESLAFYPFADFSPELAAIRWAGAHGVEVEAFDLPIGTREGAPIAGDEHEHEHEEDKEHKTLIGALLAISDSEDSNDLWDRLVEARAPGTNAEAVRRAGLLVGWAMRADAAAGGGVPWRDLRREAHMRARLGDALAAPSARVAVVVGAFHAPALLAEPMMWDDPPVAVAVAVAGARAKSATRPREPQIVTSLIPYSYELLDSRSGYPAGIRDPMWQQRVFQARLDRDAVDDALAGCVVQICRHIRGAGHVAGIPDANEAVRMALDLSRLRGLPAPGRRELLESIQSALGRGELLGRGRVLARSLDRVLVGRRRGKLAPGTPRSGLAPHVEALLVELKLPGPGAQSSEPTMLRLDPIRSPLDRRRKVALERLAVCGIPYGGHRRGDAIGDSETLTEIWEVRWAPSTEALLELAGTRGVTLQQAAEGALRAEETRARIDEKLTASARLDQLEAAAECGIVELVRERMLVLTGAFVDEATLPELLRAFALVERISRGHVAGLPVGDDFDTLPGEIDRFAIPDGFRASDLLAAAVRAVEALSGSDRIADARALLELVHLVERQPETREAIGDSRLAWALDQLAAPGASPLMQGAAGAARVGLGRESGAAFGERMGSWIDAAVDPPGTRALAKRLEGALVVAAPRFEADPGFCADLLARIEALSGDAFLSRLPALRRGFDALSPASRQRLLHALADRLGEIDPARGLDVTLDDDPVLLGLCAEADRAGSAAVARLGLVP